MRRPFARRAVRKFMPGEELSDALAAAKMLVNDRIGTIVTRLGETLTGESQADGVRDHYLGDRHLMQYVDLFERLYS